MDTRGMANDQNSYLLSLSRAYGSHALRLKAKKLCVHRANTKTFFDESHYRRVMTA